MIAGLGMQKGSAMKQSSATVTTEHASQYLRQLCRHWSHRFQVEFDDQHGVVHLPEADCVLDAAVDGLKVRLEMQDSADTARLQRVVEEHLQRFGFKEALRFDWEITASKD